MYKGRLPRSSHPIHQSPQTNSSQPNSNQFQKKKVFLIMKFISVVILAFAGALPALSAPIANPQIPNPADFNTGNGHGSCVGFDVCEGGTSGSGVGNCDGYDDCNGADDGNGFVNADGYGN